VPESEVVIMLLLYCGSDLARHRWCWTVAEAVCVQDCGVEYRELAQREEQLQMQLIKVSEENMELRFDVEQANRDIPRLKVMFCHVTCTSLIG